MYSNEMKEKLTGALKVARSGHYREKRILVRLNA